MGAYIQHVDVCCKMPFPAYWSDAPLFDDGGEELSSLIDWGKQVVFVNPLLDPADVKTEMALVSAYAAKQRAKKARRKRPNGRVRPDQYGSPEQEE